MATGVELILAAALCLSCTSRTIPDPRGLVRLDENYNEIIPKSVDVSSSISDKVRNLKNLRYWINGRKLRIATLEDYPLSYIENLPDGKIKAHGVSFVLLNFLRDKFNFTYDIVLPKRNVIGSKTDYSNSLIEMLNSNEVDMAVAFLPLLSEQRSFIFYSSTILDEGEWIMIMRRPRESASGSGLLAPFDFWVWIVILVSLLAVGPIIYVLIILRNKLTGDVEQKPYSLGHCAWFVYGGLMKQGSTLSPIANSTRLLFATWWIFITILTSFYTANLTAFLTLSKFTLPFNTVNDILNRNKHFVAARGGGIEYAIRLTNESLSMLTNMAQRNYAVFSDETNDTSTLLNYVEKDGYVFIRDRPAINHLLYLDYRYRKRMSADNEKLHCPFAMAKEPFLKKKRSFAYPIGSNLSELFDRELLNLVEAGIIKHLSGRDLPTAEICPQDLGGTERQLRNTDLVMTYYIMLAGFATSVAILTSEFLFRYLRYRRESKWARNGVGRTTNGHQLNPVKWFWRKSSPTAAKKLLGSSHSNITPPPPYQSIYNGKRGLENTSMRKWQHAVNFGSNSARGFDSLRPEGSTDNYGVDVGAVGMNIAGLESTGLRKFVNGREYMVYRTPEGQNQLVPFRAPSAALFQYTYTK